MLLWKNKNECPILHSVQSAAQQNTFQNIRICVDEAQISDKFRMLKVKDHCIDVFILFTQQMV